MYNTELETTIGGIKMDEKKVCGTCKYHQFESVDDGYVCANDESEYLSCWTEYNDSCLEWEDGNGED